MGRKNAYCLKWALGTKNAYYLKWALGRKNAYYLKWALGDEAGGRSWGTKLGDEKLGDEAPARASAANHFTPLKKQGDEAGGRSSVQSVGR